MKSTLLFFLLFTLVHSYKVTYCDSNGCTVSTSNYSQMPSETVLPFHEAAAVQTKSPKKAPDHRWQIAVASVGSVLGIAGIAAAIFTIHHKRSQTKECEEEILEDSPVIEVPRTNNSPSLKYHEDMPQALNKLTRIENQKNTIIFPI
ncbi:unnamed protein product [Rhizopus stolonifer]